jgi:hypothetical protein
MAAGSETSAVRITAPPIRANSWGLAMGGVAQDKTWLTLSAIATKCELRHPSPHCASAIFLCQFIMMTFLQNSQALGHDINNRDRFHINVFFVFSRDRERANGV